MLAIALANFFGPQTRVQKVDSSTSPVPAIWSASYSRYILVYLVVHLCDVLDSKSNDSAGPRELGMLAFAAAFCGSTTRAGLRLLSPEAPAGRGIGKLCVRLDSKAPWIQSCIVFV